MICSSGTRVALHIMVAVAAVAVVLAVGAGRGGAQTGVRPAITTRGVHFVNADGAPVILRGVNLNYHSKYRSLVTQLGVNFVRVRVLWNDVESARGVFDQAELSQLDNLVQWLNANRIAVELDLRGVPVPPWFGSPVGFWKANMHASQAAYWGFVREIVQRYQQYRYVIGYGIYNEPHPFSPSAGSHALDQTMLHWQAGIRDRILGLDPSRVVFFSVRGGNYGIKYANFRQAGFRLGHTVLDWHSFYNGCCGSGFDEQNDNWIPSWALTHNQRSHSYTGTRQNQWLNLSIPWKRTHSLRIPMIVGEWGIQNADTGRAAYNSQMSRIFRTQGVSWARWALDSNRMGLLHNGELNEQGAWLAGMISAGG